MATAYRGPSTAACRPDDRSRDTPGTSAPATRGRSGGSAAGSSRLVLHTRERAPARRGKARDVEAGGIDGHVTGLAETARAGREQALAALQARPPRQVPISRDADAPGRHAQAASSRQTGQPSKPVGR